MKGGTEQSRERQLQGCSRAFESEEAAHGPSLEQLLWMWLGSQNTEPLPLPVHGTKFLGMSGDQWRSRGWRDWVMWEKNRCWRTVFKYRRQSPEEMRRCEIDSLYRSCLLHCHDLRTVLPALAFPFTTPYMPEWSSIIEVQEKRQVVGKAWAWNPHSDLTKSGTLSKRNSHLFESLLFASAV